MLTTERDLTTGTSYVMLGVPEGSTFRVVRESQRPCFRVVKVGSRERKLRLERGGTGLNP